MIYNNFDFTTMLPLLGIGFLLIILLFAHNTISKRLNKKREKFKPFYRLVKETNNYSAASTVTYYIEKKIFFYYSEKWEWGRKWLRIQNHFVEVDFSDYESANKRLRILNDLEVGVITEVIG